LWPFEASAEQKLAAICLCAPLEMPESISTARRTATVVLKTPIERVTAAIMTNQLCIFYFFDHAGCLAGLCSLTRSGTKTKQKRLR
jgi:hypothetical protein